MLSSFIKLSSRTLHARFLAGLSACDFGVGLPTEVSGPISFGSGILRLKRNGERVNGM
jgi:hypothetical protein